MELCDYINRILAEKHKFVSIEGLIKTLIEEKFEYFGDPQKVGATNTIFVLKQFGYDLDIIADKLFFDLRFREIHTITSKVYGLYFNGTEPLEIAKILYKLAIKRKKESPIKFVRKYLQKLNVVSGIPETEFDKIIYQLEKDHAIHLDIF